MSSNIGVAMPEVVSPQTNSQDSNMTSNNSLMFDENKGIENDEMEILSSDKIVTDGEKSQSQSQISILKENVDSKRNDYSSSGGGGGGVGETATAAANDKQQNSETSSDNNKSLTFPNSIDRSSKNDLLNNVGGTESDTIRSSLEFDSSAVDCLEDGEDVDKRNTLNHNDTTNNEKSKNNNNLDISQDERDDEIRQENNMSIQKENGSLTTTTTKSDGGIVDLADDTDEDISCSNKQNESLEKTHNSEQMNSTATKVYNEADTAVIIGSDSELDESIEEKRENQNKTNASMSATEVIEDDDDDCVVIEDSPSANSDLNKRKCMTPEDSVGDDTQPPSKRIRSSFPSSTTEINSNRVQDMVKKTNDTGVGVAGGGGNLMGVGVGGVSGITVSGVVGGAAAVSGVIGGGVYPVGITPSPALMQQGPPKLVPVSNVTNPLGVGMPGLAQMTNNSSLLPGLTDDMFVLEAPSFIVPYIYEKPPGVTLTTIVKEIETTFNLSKEDLAEADKPDEFDMMTEQNKADKIENENEVKKKKKRWGGDDGDESWSEQSEEEEDDDDDSDSQMRTKVLIKEASDDISAFKGAIKSASAVAQQTPSTATGPQPKPGQENYFESPLGKFFMDIGVGLVQEFVQSDLIKLQKRKMRKSLGKGTVDFERAIAALSGNLEASKKKNSPFKFTMKRCEFCNFKSESALAMANHYETPHMNGALYKCNFCSFEIRNATEIVYHMEAVHNIKARLIKPLPYHQCPNCGFEDNGKAKLARHQPVCAKKFRPELNLAPPNDWEAPAKIPRIKPRHGLVGTATAYQAMAAQAAAQKAALATIQQQQQQQAAQARNIQAATIAAQNAANKLRGRQPIVQRPMPTNPGMVRSPNPIRSPMSSNIVISNNYPLPNNQLLQASNAMNKKPMSGQPSISITPLPRQTIAPPPAAPLPSTSNKLPTAGVKPGQNPAGGNKAQFVICEICDAYIKDLEQLRNHMQWMHKVKIHPKMIYNRPPLNCQKCQFRFFTDQGLERHLLGSHGLVTSSMQEAANKGKDSGRCPVCGRMYQWKLLNHVSRDHHMTLKPAHLSYKCTVCTATFGMYKQFENHVYTAHSTVAKRAMDGKKTNAPGPSSSSGGGQRPPSSNDSILKPLKINDEITIIPQPATKPRITNIESHVID